MRTSKTPTTPVQFLKGIGPRRADALKSQGIESVGDLLYYFPFSYTDLQQVEKIGNLSQSVQSGKHVTVLGAVRTFDLVGRPPRQRFVIILGDETGTIQLVFFRSVQFFKTAFHVGDQLAVSGKVTEFRHRIQIIHPSIDRLGANDEEEGDLKALLHTGGIIPKYGTSEELREVNLHVKGLRRIMRSVVDQFADEMADGLPVSVRESQKLLPLHIALRNIHFPESAELLEDSRRRLKFDELFTMQIMLALRKKQVKVESPGITFSPGGLLVQALIKRLPFSLTRAQQRVLDEIRIDMESPRPMNRLIQGDVGSGKTIVALIAMLTAIDNGYQIAFMSPTEVLAEQHFRTLSQFLPGGGVNMRLLLGGQSPRLREDILEDIRKGTANLVVGTHALIQEHVQFAKLGLVVIDEQHRFGVAQRLALREKGSPEGAGPQPVPDMLIMTATPIPRTLSLTLYGDLDVSTIDELPPGRRAVRTGLRFASQSTAVYGFLRDQVKEGRQVYIVYPLVEESEKLDLKAATESYEKLRTTVFADLRLGLLHGRMGQDEKEMVMRSLKEHAIDILISTTVIEVGIDIPNASVMVVEHAERFGLSQLHQLRGRVGRGSAQSYCILMAPDYLRPLLKGTVSMPQPDGEKDDSQHAVRRLQTMVGTNDGFKIAEIDLEIRGPGDFFGTRQSGVPLLQLANLMTDYNLLELARAEAYRVVDADPHLRRSEHLALRQEIAPRVQEMFALLHGG